VATTTLSARSEQPQSVPPLPPDITNALVLVDDRKRQTATTEVIADGQTRLARADDQGFRLLSLQFVEPPSSIWKPMLANATEHDIGGITQSRSS
jgi:hypothetical protein